VMHLTNTDRDAAQHRLKFAADQAGVRLEQAATSLIALYFEPDV
jgi:hypothetical protein